MAGRAAVKRVQLELRSDPFDQRAQRDLERIADMTSELVAEFRAGVADGAFTCAAVWAEGERIGTMIFCTMRDRDTRILVVNALAARPLGAVCLTGELHELMAALAQSLECTRMRCWTRRPGLSRKLERMGYDKRFVMEVAL